MRFIDLTNQKFGELTVLERVFSEKLTKKHTYWKCRCKCGNEIVTSSNHLRTGHTKSCGCAHNNLTGKNNPSYKHGKRNTRLFSIWSGMKSRCLCSTNAKYKNYGGRGIKICNQWLDNDKGFINFYNWAINNGYKESLTLDRYDVNGNYAPDNCRWITLQEQNMNKTTTKYVVYKHKKKTLKEWAQIYEIDYNLLYQRLFRGWDIEKALLTPVKH